MENLRLAFREQIGRRNTERDVLYGQLHLEACRAWEKHCGHCVECEKARVTA
jgi:hypothetical protein